MSAPVYKPDTVSPAVLSVSDLLRQTRGLLESSLPLGWVAGELSNLVRAASGHVYFTLKDPGAQIRCAMWRNRAQLLPFRLEEGMQVEVRAQITLYEARGDLQLSVESVRRAGLGNLYEAFLRLKAKLESEGLFAIERKRALPERPAGVGIVTSLQAAALRDVLATLKRRAPHMAVCIYPTPVQGDAAGAAIAAAITAAGSRARADGVQVLIVCRGGGSLEDLWAFNDEQVVRAVHACPLPVVSGVGHETDITLCDFAADQRAATPTAAAEAVSAGWVELRSHLPAWQPVLQRAMQRRLATASQRLDLLQRRLLHPRDRLGRAAQRLADLERRLQQSTAGNLAKARTRHAVLATRLLAAQPRPQVLRERLQWRAGQLTQAMQRRVALAQLHVAGQAARLQALNPEAVLQRGYAIVRDAQGRVLKQAAAVSPGTALDVRLADGALQVEVRAIHEQASGQEQARGEHMRGERDAG
ncbi:exodeoxyribonuclease VII large subunit [Uliginosibacterium sp. H1]|uniref:exodeoxyribonuclease VII large subunit n=1 Tax=Uliginosibacterium sp. H1 TaxID=3114757 RepID=UPI002E197D5F|nr:exodeoxyribonuclease VII large subunit [Uliginosibacterium sp. H1]